MTQFMILISIREFYKILSPSACVWFLEKEIRKSQCGNKAPRCGGGLSPEAERMAGGLICAALDR